jgi:cytochrome c556
MIAAVRTLSRTVALAVLAGACASQPRSEPPQQKQLLAAVSPPERLEPPEALPEPARAALRSHMANHAQDMSALMSAIMVLRYAEIRDRARAIADDASLARPLTGDAAALAAQLPDKFFAYHDELRARAADLAGAADKQGAFAVADAYGRMSETCVRCHATYRQGR